MNDEYLKSFLEQELKRVERLIDEFNPLEHTEYILKYLTNQKRMLNEAINGDDVNE